MVEWIALGVATLALLASTGQWFAAATANLLSASDPWATRVLEYVVDAIRFAYEDKQRFRNFYCVPFEDEAAKREKKARLYENRDQEDRNLATLSQLVEDEELTNLKARRDRVEDSYLQNAELNLADKIANGLVGQYGEHAARYIDALRELSYTLSRTRKRMLKDAQKRQKERLKGRKPKQVGSGDRG